MGETTPSKGAEVHNSRRGRRGIVKGEEAALEGVDGGGVGGQRTVWM